MLARPLTVVSDPMSGFFGIHKKYVSQFIIKLIGSLNKLRISTLMDSKLHLIFS